MHPALCTVFSGTSDNRIPKGASRGNAAAKAKGTYLRDKFYRLKARRGYKRAAVAVAHKILVAIYHMKFSRQAWTS